MMKKTVLLLVLFLGTLALGMAQSKENDFLEQPYIEVTGTAMMEVVPDEIYVKIILREKRGHDAQGRFSALLGFLFLFPAFAGRKTKHYGNGKSGRRKTAKKFFHKNTPDIKR